MTSFDFSLGSRRLAAAMSTGGGEVPFIAQMHEFAMRESGIPGSEFYTDPKKFVRGICETAERHGFDTPSFIWDVYNVEAEALGCRLVTFEEMAPAIDSAVPLVATEADLARLRAPDPYSTGRMPMVFELLHEVRSRAGLEGLPCYCAPFTLASQVMSFERLIVQIRENPGFVHRVLTFLVDEVIAPYMNALLAEFPEAPVADGSDAVASPPFITQSMLEEFSLAYIERLQRQTVRPAICDNWWGDSRAEDLHGFWRQKLRATPTYLKVQDPDLFRIGVAPVIEFARAADVPVVLGVDNSVLQNGPREEIEQRVHEYMEAVEEAGRGALYLCSLSAVTPAENVATAVSAVRAFRSGDRPWAGVRRSGAAQAQHAQAAEPKRVASAPAETPDAESSPADDLLDEIFEAVLDGEDEAAAAAVERALALPVGVETILDDALIAAMDDVGTQFSEGRIFVPEMLMAAQAMKAGLEILRPVLTSTAARPKGRVLLATVQGDVHDIGKNLVAMMLEGAGFEVVDLGVNQTPAAILERANEIEPDVVGLSALLTTSMPSMQRTVALFKERGSLHPIVVGGAPVTREYAGAIRADGYGENAPDAVGEVQRLVARKHNRLAV